MSKLQLYVLDNDMAYAESLAAFIRSTDFSERIQVKLFSQSERLLEVLKEQPSGGILLLSEAFYPVYEHQSTTLYRVFLSEHVANSNCSETPVPFLFRYQPLQSLLSRLIALYTEGHQLERRSTDLRRTRVISVYSTSGNSGKSVTAMHMAKQLAFRGDRVMYVSLESVSQASQWLQGESSRLTQLLYYLKGSPELLGAKLELLKSHDPHLRIDYLAPQDQVREMQELTGEHIRQLIESILHMDVYDTLIIDLEASVHPRIVKSLEMSDDILWLVRDDWNDACKTQTLLKQMSHYQRIHYVMTSFRGTQTNTYDFLDQPIRHKLPYIPEWKIMSAPEQVWQAEIFSEQVYSMLTAILSESERASHVMEGGETIFESRAIQ